MDNRLSVIVPVFNSEKYLSRCVESITSQSYKDFELILVDDGSSDSSYEICKEYSRSDNRIKVLHKENGGANSARLEGIRHSETTWITFVDSDDTLPQDALLCLMAMADKENTDLVVGFLDEKTVYKENITLKEYRSLLIKQQYIHSGPCAKLFKREYLTSDVFDIPASITRGEDLIMNIRYAFKISHAPSMVNKRIYNYIRRSDSTSFTALSSASFEGDNVYYQQILKSIPQENLNEHLDDLIDFRISTIMIQLTLHPSNRGGTTRHIIMNCGRI